MRDSNKNLGNWSDQPDRQPAINAHKLDQLPNRSTLTLPRITRRLASAPEIRRHDQTLVTGTDEVQRGTVLLTRIVAQADKQGRVYARAGPAATAHGVRCSAVCITELLHGPWLF